MGAESEDAADNGDSFHAGRLLVAAPTLVDPNFAKAVVLLLDHDSDGALGVVLNRPTEVEVAEVLPGWNAVVSSPEVVFRGGPVSTDSALGVAQVAGSEEPVGFRTMFASLDPSVAGSIDSTASGQRRTGLVDLDTPIELLAGALASMRVFAGYAGWGPGQLETEIEADGWFVLDAEPNDISGNQPGRLWRTVLRRQHGELALMSTYPPDVSLN